ncbi:hypothetical protein BDR22DRAFT_335741 [Usnea florida]
MIKLVALIVCTQSSGTLGQYHRQAPRFAKDRQAAKQMRTFEKLKGEWQLSRVTSPQRFLLADAGHGNEIEILLTEACSTVTSWCLLQAPMLQ